MTYRVPVAPSENSARRSQTGAFFYLGILVEARLAVRGA